MKIYFDTEFCNLWDPTPISFGFAADDGSELYVEVHHEHTRHGEFVNKVVVPLLRGEPKTLDIARELIRGYLYRLQATPQETELVCDFIGDYWILKGLVPNIGRSVTPRCAYGANTDPVFKAHPELRQHNALDDARALRYLRPALQVE